MKYIIYITLIGFLFLTSCQGNNDYSPKPKGYFRIMYPGKKYQAFTENAPFSFEYPVYATVVKDPERNAAPYWYNLSFQQFNSRLHLTYYSISSIKQYEMMVEDARKLAFKHTVKASAIDQKLINYPDHKVYGVYYEIEGNTASSVQFFLTDSTKHYFRGALYFNERPQYDSIAPVVDFIKKDIDHLISTFRWKDEAVALKKQQKGVKNILAGGNISLMAKSDRNLPVSKVARAPVDAVAWTGSKYARTVAYTSMELPADSLEQTASRFFNLLISGQTAQAYTYFDTDFTDKVSPEQFAAIHKMWLNMFGNFKNIEKVVALKQGENNLVLLTAQFDKAKPAFTLYFNAGGKIIGLFKTADNFLARNTDPAYADKNLFEEKDIVVQTGSYKLPGTLTVPKNKTDFPVVVFVHGSGPGDRDETVDQVKTFRDLAQGLAVNGIATIRYDKRTKVYEANSAPAGQMLTVKEETEDDALSAIKMAATVNGANPKKIFLLGHSLGAMMAPHIANQAPELGGVITMGTPARKFADLLSDQFTYLFSLGPQTDAGDLQLAVLRAQVNEIRHADTIPDQKKPIFGANAYYWTNLNAYDQVAEALKLKLPVLMLQGESDYNVTLTDFNLWKEKLKHKKNVSFILYPKLNHAFTQSAGAVGTPADYQTPTNVPKYVIDDITAFINK